MSQPDQIPTPQVPAGSLTDPQDDGGKGPHIGAVQIVDSGGGKGPHSNITVQALQPTDSMVSPSLQTPTVPSPEEGKDPH